MAEEKSTSTLAIRDQLSDIMRPKPNIKWEEVAGMEKVKDTLKEYVILPMKFPQLFRGCRAPHRFGILLYGAPGSGKSLLLKAVVTAACTEPDRTFIGVSACDLMFNRLDMGPKVLEVMFEMAREKGPSVICIDDIDLLCTSACGREYGQMLELQMTDRLNQGIRVIGTTSVPWKLSPGFRRKFERRLYVPLPDKNARTDIIRLEMKKNSYNLSESDMVQIGRRTDGFSGADMYVLISDARMQPVRDLQKATHFQKVQCNSTSEGETLQDKYMWQPCSADDSHATGMTWTDISPDKLMIPEVTMKDFELPLASLKPPVTEEDLKKYRQYAEDFGAL